MSTEILQREKIAAGSCSSEALNILFVLYGDSGSNSLAQCARFADELQTRGHLCVIALRGITHQWSRHVSSARVITHQELLSGTKVFENSGQANIVIAWTPRIDVMRAVLAYQRMHSGTARVIVHLEDDERHLVAHAAGVPFDRLLVWRPWRLRRYMARGLAHPYRHQLFLYCADAISIVTPALAGFVPRGIPCFHLRPGLDPEDFLVRSAFPPIINHSLTAKRQRNIYFPGGINATNAEDVRTLYAATVLLNRAGWKTTLMRSGPDHPRFDLMLTDEERAVSTHLGFLSRDAVREWLRKSDVLVQPGKSGPFNDSRLPGKIPEFLASGRPVIVPATNIGRELRDGEHALLLTSGTPEEICARCQEIFSDPMLGWRLGKAAQSFAQSNFGLMQNTDLLEALLAAVLRARPAVPWFRLGFARPDESDLVPLITRHLPPDALALAVQARSHRRLERLLYRLSLFAGWGGAR